MLLDITQKDGCLNVSYFNKNGGKSVKTYKLEDKDLFDWYLAKPKDKGIDKNVVNWDGSPVKKHKVKRIGKYRIIEYLEKEIPREDYEEIFEYNFPKIYFLDIENKITPGVSVKESAERAEGEVTAISIVSTDHRCLVLATRPLSAKEQEDIQKKIDNHFAQLGDDIHFEFIYKYFKTEYDMLYTLFNKLIPKFPLMSGWNVVDYDWKYLVNRCKRLSIDVTMASPFKVTNGQELFPSGVCILDYQAVYRKWDRSVDIKEDFKLDTAGRDVLGIKKVKYNGTLDDLYEEDFPKYIYYNAIDSCLLCLIHEKVKTMEIALTISHISHIAIQNCESPLWVTESLFCMEFLKHNKVMATDPDRVESPQTTYEGAFVKEPVVGKHNVVACFDFASLYPSTMREFNISPENLIKIIPENEVDSELKKGNYIVTQSGCVFGKEESILKSISNRLYGQRKQYKNKMWEYQLKAADLRKRIDEIEKNS